MDRVRNEEVRRRAGIEMELVSRADQRVLRGLVMWKEWMTTVWPEGCMAEVSGGRVRGRQRLGWMDGVKVALDNRGMKVEAARQCAKDRKEWRALVHEFHAAILLGPVFFQTALPCSGGYHMERGGMPLHDVVGINCKKGGTTDNQGSAVKYMG